MRYLPAVLITLVLALIAAEVIAAVRRSRRPASPQDGCCGCGAAECDVVVDANEHGRGEGYCWLCVDTWPALAPSLSVLGMTVFPGRERSAR